MLKYGSKEFDALYLRNCASRVGLAIHRLGDVVWKRKVAGDSHLTEGLVLPLSRLWGWNSVVYGLQIVCWLRLRRDAEQWWT